MKFSRLTIVAPRGPSSRATYAPAKPPPSTRTPPSAVRSIIATLLASSDAPPAGNRGAAPLPAALPLGAPRLRRQRPRAPGHRRRRDPARGRRGRSGARRRPLAPLRALRLVAADAGAGGGDARDAPAAGADRAAAPRAGAPRPDRPPDHRDRPRRPLHRPRPALGRCVPLRVARGPPPQ